MSGYPLKLVSGNTNLVCSAASGTVVSGGLVSDTFGVTGAANLLSLGVGAVYATSLRSNGSANAVSLGVGQLYASTLVTAGNIVFGSQAANSAVLIAGVSGVGSGVNLDMSSFATGTGSSTVPGIRVQVLDQGSYMDSLNLLQQSATTGTALTSRLYLNAAGQFGFGTTAPAQIIDVLGNIRASASLISNSATIGNTATVGALVATSVTATSVTATSVTANTANAVALLANGLQVFGNSSVTGNLVVGADTAIAGNVSAAYMRGTGGGVVGNVFSVTLPVSGDHGQAWFKYFLPTAQTFSVAVAPAGDGNAANYSYSMYSSTGGAGGGYALNALSQFSNGVVVAANCPGNTSQHWLCLTSVAGFGGASTQVDVVAGGATANGTYRNTGTIQYSKVAANLQVLILTSSTTGANVRYGMQAVNYL